MDWRDPIHIQAETSNLVEKVNRRGVYAGWRILTAGGQVDQVASLNLTFIAGPRWIEMNEELAVLYAKEQHWFQVF